MTSPIFNSKQKLFSKKISELDCQSANSGKAKFSFFLDPSEIEIAKLSFENKGVFYGGFWGAQRQMLGVFPKNILVNCADFPITAVRIINHKDKKLDHRSVLGSLMSLGISRESLGDIITEIGGTTVICTDLIANIIINELKKVGSEGVSVRKTGTEGIVFSQDFLEIHGTISSIRLDCLVAMLCNFSRTKVLECFRQQKIFYNYKMEEKPSGNFKQGDIITIRGQGKFIVDDIGELSRKGKIKIKCRKYV